MVSSSAHTVRFGPFQLDLRAAELQHNGSKTKLPEQPFQVLAALLEHPGDVVTREELRQRLWGSDTFVDFEHGLNTAVKRLREVLGDSAEKPHYIETVPRHGYRLIVPVEKLESAAPTGSEPPVHRRKLWLVALAVVLVALATGLVWRQRLLERFRPTKIESLAVLPLENLSGNPEEEYFSDGMTEALITELGKVHALRVISRQSVMQYKGTNKPVPQIARELHVDAVVEGSAMRSGDKVRITAQLIQANPERHLWSESYERDLSDVITLQREVTQEIARGIGLELTPEEHAALRQTRAVNPAALDAYLKGIYSMNRLGAGARNVTGIGHFRRAIASDPTYAPPYAGLCVAYTHMSFGTGPLPPAQAFGEMERAAQVAASLDPNLADAHTCLAWVEAFGHWDWSGADIGFRDAIELNRNSVQAHRLYAWYLIAMGRNEGAIAESQHAFDLDPSSPQANYTLSSAYYFARQYEGSAVAARNLEQMDETYPGAQHMLGAVCLQKEQYDEAIRHFRRAIALSGDDVPIWVLAHLAYADARSGNRTEALKLLDQILSASKRTYVSPYSMAYVYTGLDDKDKAFECLERAYIDRVSMMGLLRYDPLFKPLRPDPRFQDLVRRMNFPEH
jgi:TolB-like protein/DNA-binding winged helix-turn-helix (wHTH) protein/Flp pilus assembly protein TadD